MYLYFCILIIKKIIKKNYIVLKSEKNLLIYIISGSISMGCTNTLPTLKSYSSRHVFIGATLVMIAGKKLLWCIPASDYRGSLLLVFQRGFRVFYNMQLEEKTSSFEKNDDIIFFNTSFLQKRSARNEEDCFLQLIKNHLKEDVEKFREYFRLISIQFNFIIQKYINRQHHTIEILFWMRFRRNY